MELVMCVYQPCASSGIQIRHTSSYPGRYPNQFRKLIGLIVSTLPVEALYADVSANAESVAPEALDRADFVQIVAATWRFLRQGGLSKSETETRMRSSDPFRTNWAETVKVIRSLDA